MNSQYKRVLKTNADLRSITSATQYQENHSQRRRRILFVILAGAAIFRFATLGRQPLWFDEAADASFAARTFWNCVFAEHVHPPLYRALLHFIILPLGNSATVLRFQL